MTTEEVATRILTLMEQRSELVLSKYRQTEQQRQQLVDLQNEIATLDAPFNEQIVTLETEISLLMLQVEESVETDFGTIRYRRNPIRKIWDTAALKSYAIDHPDVMECQKMSGSGDPTIKFEDTFLNIPTAKEE